LLGLHWDPEDGSSTVFCNVDELTPEYMASRPISNPLITVKTSIGWYVLPGRPLNVYRSFGGTYRLHPSSLGISQEIKKHEAGNKDFSTNYRALYRRR
jgi:hypothetical protein